MDGSLRATCPRCRSSLRIPAQWVGQTVKCKNCGAVVRSKLKPGVAIDGGEMDSEIVEGLPLGAMPTPEVVDAAPLGSPFDEMGKTLRAANENPFDSHHDAHAPQHIHDLGGFDPATAPQSPDHPMAGFGPQPGYDPSAAGYAPPPGYPYPIPPGPPAGYGPPPGYPYPAPPGYPYPMPPGYGPPQGYAPPPGYPYPMPPGYAPPQGYGPPPGYPYPAPQPQAAPPVYPQPAAPVQVARTPDIVPESSVFKSDEPIVGSPVRSRYHKAGPGNKLVWVGLCLVLTCGLVAGGVYLKSATGKKTDTVEKNEKDTKDKDGKDKDGGKDTKGGGTRPVAVAAAGNTPRRMLFIHVSNYMFMNPLTSAADNGAGSRGVDLVKPAAARFAFEWRIPSAPDNNQLYVLADTLPNTESRFPLKPVITGTYEKFFETSRAQDRVVVYFGGHALEQDGKVYLVPAEGAADEMPTLIPLDDFYAKIKDCKATQKVVIWDVCRFNFQRGKQGPGSEPMTEGLFKALSAPPPGVQAVVTASPGQNALEFFDLQPDGMPQRGKGITSVAGSNFLDAMRNVAEKGKVTNKSAGANDPLPIAAWVEAINKRAGEVAAYASQSAGADFKQTVTLHGAAPETLVSHDPAAKFADRFELPQPPRGAGSGEIGSIESEYYVPPFKADLQVPSLAQFPFTVEALKDFKAVEPLDDLLKDREKNKFVAKTHAAYQIIREVWSTGVDGSKLRNSIEVPVNEAKKKEIKEEQVPIATAILKLETAMVELEGVAGMKAEQPKRWQAHYDYAMALLKARQAYMHEYDLLMGNVHTDTLPPIDAKQGHVGLKLLTTDKMKSKADVKKLATDAVELYEKMIKDYPGTPWAMQAKRERGIPLGLTWLPYSAGDDK
ncbi:MAG TPA: hypothetical protein VMZ71_02790 [Gemmataceae bacterium]|nr:hypothetical protein [Gemmataceae bacterium]